MLNKKSYFVIFMIILGLFLIMFLGNKRFIEGFTSSNSITFKAVPTSDPNSPIATINYPNNDMNTLNFTLNNKTITYTLTNKSSNVPITYSYSGNDSSTGRLIIPPATNTGPDKDIKQLFAVTSSSGQIVSYASTTDFVDPSNTTSSSSSNSNLSSSNSLSSNSSINSSGPLNSNYDNYNHFSNTTSTLTNNTVYYGPNGSTAVFITNSDGTQTLQVYPSQGLAPITFTSQQLNNMSGNNTIVFYGPNGTTATLINNQSGQNIITVQTQNGTQTYTLQIPSQNNPLTPSQYYGSTGYSSYPSQSISYDSSQLNSIIGTLGSLFSNALANQQQSQATTQQSNQSSYSDNNMTSATNSQYYDSLPTGIPQSQIPPGQEDLYILKSQVVPPVCPVCPAYPSYQTNNSNSSNKKCPPCPPCARCPEPSFECKKVPNYKAMNNEYLPQPVVSSFASFGM